MKSKTALTLIICLGMILGVSVAAFAGGKQESKSSSAPAKQTTAATSTPKYGGVLQIGTGQAIPEVGYTPEIANNSEMEFLQPDFNTLVFYNATGDLVPELATSWSSDASSKTVTFQLRQGVQFQDGTPFNAQAVKWNIDQYQKAKRTEVSDIQSISTPDAHTVVLHLKQWDSSVLVAVGFYVYFMSPTAVEKHGVDWAHTHAVGTGPFILKSFDPNVSITYVKNPNYWQKGKPYLDGIKFQIIPDATTAATALQSGAIDLLSYASLLTVKNLLAQGGFIRETNHNGIGVESTGVIPNSANPKSPFHNAIVRKAFCYAINRQAIDKAIGYGLLTPTDQWAAPGSKTYNPNVVGYPYNPAKAKELLAQAGYPHGFDTVIWAYSGDNMMPAVAQMLDAVGIHAKIELANGPKLNSNMLDGWTGVMYHWASIGPDLGLYMGRHLDPNGAYFAKGILHPADTLALLQKVRTAPNSKLKLKYEWQLQKLIYDKYALFGKVLYVTSIDTMKRPYVKGDNWTKFDAASWTPQDTWLDK